MTTKPLPKAKSTLGNEFLKKYKKPPALHVEAVRDGEEPVSFGPSAALVDYSRGWRL